MLLQYLNEKAVIFKGEKTHLKLLVGFGYDERHEGQRKGCDHKQLSLILYSYISRSSNIIMA